LKHSTLLRPLTSLQPLQKIRLIKGNLRPQARIHRAQIFAEQFQNSAGQGRFRMQHPGQCSKLNIVPSKPNATGVSLANADLNRNAPRFQAWNKRKVGTRRGK